MLVVWALALITYFFQVPFSFLASLIVPLLGLFMMLSIVNRNLKIQKIDAVFVLLMIYILFSIVISMTHGVALAKIIRFTLIISMIPLFSLIEMKDKKSFQRIFLIIACMKSFFIIYLAVKIVMAYHFGIGSYWNMRFHFIESGFGDVYVASGIPKIQIQGNGILPIAFMLSCLNSNESYSKVMSAILLAGILLAGNFAFYLGILFFGLYIMYKLFKSNSKRKWLQYTKCLIVAALPFAVFFVAYYVRNQISLKSGESNAIRIEQMQALISGNWIIGNGLGSSVDYVGKFRDYTGDIYFELQTLYVFFQIGLVGIVLFFLCMFLRFNKKRKECLILFLIYLTYTFWNPYCFDTTEMMAIVLIMNMTNSNKASYLIHNILYGKGC
ncbi:hypothetical protein [Ruminococcus flavefaciens]|uniref:hypothetical protein n=1 Tax=Ruminococcus flavefaciens TaxID=1265 RepID=UPI000466D809|nr:hypothetical protein [Ruminococcus flavefaciens]